MKKFENSKTFAGHGDEHNNNINLDEKYDYVVKKHRVSNANDTGFKHDFFRGIFKFYMKNLIIMII